MSAPLSPQFITEIKQHLLEDKVKFEKELGLVEAKNPNEADDLTVQFPDLCGRRSLANSKPETSSSNSDFFGRHESNEGSWCYSQDQCNRENGARSYINNFLYELWLPFKYYRTLGRCDIFRTNQNSGSIAAAIAKLLFRKKRLIVRSGYLGSELARRSGLSILVKGYYFLAENLSYRLCDRALITTEANQHLLLQKYPFMEERVIVHNNFIDTNHFKKHSNARKQYDIIYVARYDRDKNHRAILDALKSTLRSALFIGQGKTLPSIEAEAAKDGTRVSFVKSVRNDDLPALYNAARICAFPSLHEGSPKSLLEAMACELPVAALHAPGVSNVINDRQNGLIGNQHLFAGNIERLLNDHALCDRLGQSARQTVLADYSFKKISSGEIQLYQKLLGL
jgi:glycosyltransferase involved in cell wall biosynthesis